MTAIAQEAGISIWNSAVLAALGVVVAETLEGLRLYVAGDGRGGHRWPTTLPLRNYLVAGGLRLALGASVAISLAVMGMACNGTLPFLAGLATLKTLEVVFGYAETSHDSDREWGPQ